MTYKCRYASLGPLTFRETAVSFYFLILVSLWFFQVANFLWFFQVAKFFDHLSIWSLVQNFVLYIQVHYSLLPFFVIYSVGARIHSWLGRLLCSPKRGAFSWSDCFDLLCIDLYIFVYLRRFTLIDPVLIWMVAEDRWSCDLVTSPLQRSTSVGKPRRNCKAWWVDCPTFWLVLLLMFLAIFYWNPYPGNDDDKVGGPYFDSHWWLYGDSGSRWVKQPQQSSYFSYYLSPQPGLPPTVWSTER